MINSKNIILSYEYFYSRFYKNLKYKFFPTGSAQKQIGNFLVLLKKENKHTIGINYLFDYFTFQFDYWDGLELEIKESFSNKVVLSYIIGPKAYKRYKLRDQYYDWQIQDSRIFKKYGIDKSEYKKLFQEIKKGEYDETPIKLLNYGTDKGFNNCLMFTTLYNHRNLICFKCIYKVECKKLLEVNYPKKYEERGYNKLSK